MVHYVGILEGRGKTWSIRLEINPVMIVKTSVGVGETCELTFTYDELGRTKSVTSGGQTTTLGYDFEDRLTSIVHPGGAVSNYPYNRRSRAEGG